jgi:hypothetical protein
MTVENACLSVGRRVLEEINISESLFTLSTQTIPLCQTESGVLDSYSGTLRTGTSLFPSQDHILQFPSPPNI